MVEEKIFKLDEIKEIRLNWDCENVIFPQNIIRGFSCIYNSEKNNYYKYGLYLENAYLELDLDYVMNEYAYFENIKQNDRKIIDLLNMNSVWYIAITTNDNMEYILELPFYNKDFYIKEDVNVYNVTNVFEIHEKANNSYIIKWEYNKDKTKLDIDEMVTLFKNKKKRGAPLTNNNFQIEILNHLLKEKSETERLEFFSVFCKLLENEIYGIRNEYQINVISQDEKDFSNVSLNIKSNIDNGNISYIFVKNEKTYNKLFDFINSINKNTDFSKLILIFNDGINDYNIFESIKTNNIILIDLDKMNQILFDMIHGWGI